MGILTELVAPNIRAVDTSPGSDYWYNPVGSASATGVRVSAESALGISTVYACVSAIAQDIGAMPLHLYRKAANGDRHRAVEIALYRILNRQPNRWQTSQEFVEMMLGHLLLRGNAYCFIESGPSGFVDQLVPLNPAGMKVAQLSSNRLRYTYQQRDGRSVIYNPEQIWHIKGLSSDGLVGLGVVSLAREAFGLGLAYEQYAARFFSQSAEPKGVLMTKGKLQEDQAQRIASQWQGAHSGLGNAHKTAILEDGTTWQAVGVSNEDSQFLQSRGLQVEEMARWFHMPLTRIGHTEKATSWGTGLEQFNIGYITYALLPWMRRIENRIGVDLILDQSGNLFAEFLMNHLLRGDTAARFAAYHSAILDGWLSRNEVRAMENRNGIEGLDDMLVPLNMETVTSLAADANGESLRTWRRALTLQSSTRAALMTINEARAELGLTPVEWGDEPFISNQGGGGGEGDGGGAGATNLSMVDPRARLFATQLAAMAVRRETAAMSKIQKRHADDPESLGAAVDEFYLQHAGLLAKDLGVSITEAEGYCDRQRDNLASDEDKIRELATMAMGGIDG